MTAKNIHIIVMLLALLHSGNAMAQKQANNHLAFTDDCSHIAVNYENNPNLTRQEKINLMDKALLHSLNKYEACQHNISSKTTKKSADNQSDSQAGNAGSGTSTASSTMTGTEIVNTQDTSKKVSNKQAKQQSDNHVQTAAAITNDQAPPTNGPAKQQRNHLKGSGRVPEDIPAIDNDSILEAQIRQAAMHESDPEIQARLWNEYRKYKGLPSKP